MPNEQQLVADFRRLDAAGKKELLEYAASLLKRSLSAEQENPEQGKQCRLEARSEERPEAADEAIFTE